MLNDVVVGSAAEAGDKTGAASVVVGVAPIGMAALRRQGPSIVKTVLASTVTEVHTSLSNEWGVVVQRRILILWIDFLIRKVWVGRLGSVHVLGDRSMSAGRHPG